jgi:2-oxoglutarate dehydrogenase E1 component
LNVGFLEDLYAQYLKDPSSVSGSWRRYFESLSGGKSGANGATSASYAVAGAPRPSFRPASIFRPTGKAGVYGGNGRPADQVAVLQDRVDKMVRAHRVRAHMIARLDPLGLPRHSPPELDPSFSGITAADLLEPVSERTLSGGDATPVGAVLGRLRNTYCRSIGVQFMHIDDESVREWLQARMEGTENRLQLTREEQLRILTRLTGAVIFEEFLQKKFVGAKSFSLGGCESLIPLLDLAIEKAGRQGVDEIVLAMAHRGRLNVLVNIMGKSAQQIFREFEDVDPHLHHLRGDV